jgi:hypothetical protein
MRLSMGSTRALARMDGLCVCIFVILIAVAVAVAALPKHLECLRSSLCPRCHEDLVVGDPNLLVIPHPRSRALLLALIRERSHLRRHSFGSVNPPIFWGRKHHSLPILLQYFDA